MNTSTTLARTLTRELIEGGVTDVVLSPGSRNAPLSIALFAAEEAGLLTLHIRIDERTAGFFALGIAKATERPVALVCTSGTAVANYHPAILEAYHSQIPILAISADRPEKLRETGANQTTLQAGIFTSTIVYEADISDPDIKLTRAFNGLQSGPVHLNIQFDEPLLPDDSEKWLKGVKAGKWKSQREQLPEELHLTQPRGVIVVGHDRGGFSVAEIDTLAKEIGWPLIAEDPLSFSHSIAHASLFLSSESTRESLQPQVAIVVGRTTLSRSTNALIRSAKLEIVIDPRTSNVDMKRSADQIFQTLPIVKKEFSPDDQWLEQWKAASSRSLSAISSLPKWSEENIAREIASSLPEGSALFISSSRPIRDIEGFASPRSGVEVFANRGLAGIDGNISSALGVSLSRKTTTAVLGDLSFLHDITGLLGAPKTNLRILVINNDGGGIFSTLPQSGVEGFEKIFGTPHGRNLESIATSFGISATTVKNLEELKEVIDAPVKGLSVVVIEVPSREKNAQILKKVLTALL